MSKKTEPIKDKEDVARHPDNKIDQDFKGYPHGHAREEIIKPETEEEKKTADLDNKDGEKRSYKKNETDEQDSDGSANAFDDK
jgi:hypothetical protein